MRRCAMAAIVGLVCVSSAAAQSPGTTSPAAAASAHIERARLLVAQRLYTQAIAEHTQALDLDPRRADAYRARADAWVQRGQCGLAIDDYNRALAIVRVDAQSFLGRGRCLHAQGQFERAVEDYSLAARLASNPEAYTLRAHVALARGDFNSAGADVKRAISADPREPAHLIHLGIVRYFMGQYALAVDNLTRALRYRDDMRGMLFLYLAQAHLGQDARADLERRAGYVRERVWPFALLEFYLGNKSAAQVMQLSGTDLALCQSGYFVGELALISGSRSDGVAALKQALRVCHKNSLEYAAASAALRLNNAL